MNGRFEVKNEEFNLLPKNLGAFKEFLATVPDHAKYQIDTREDGVFFTTYWLGVVDSTVQDSETTYTIKLPHICLYGKLANDLVDDLHPIAGLPFIIDASDTINLSKGFVDIIVRRIAYWNSPYIIVEGWVKEHMQLLEDATFKYKMPVRDYNEQSFF